MRGLVLTSVSLFVCASLLWLIGKPSDRQRSKDLPEKALALRTLHKAPPEPQDGDWIRGPGRHEQGQTYEQWRASDPVRAVAPRRVLYVVRLGAIDEARAAIVKDAATFLGVYYGLPVTWLDPVEDVSSWHATSRRDRGGARPQLNSRYILERVLAPRLPEDAAALLALTSYDLWPGDNWNFVFGQASLQARVGVWSLARFGDPKAGEDARLRCLLRTLKVACHETGHMFSFAHCRAYACAMAGSNTMAETDRQPLWLCPECLAKTWDATKVDPVTRFEALARQSRALGLDEEAAFYDASLARVRAVGDAD